MKLFSFCIQILKTTYQFYCYCFGDSKHHKYIYKVLCPIIQLRKKQLRILRWLITSYLRSDSKQPGTRIDCTFLDRWELSTEKVGLKEERRGVAQTCASVMMLHNEQQKRKQISWHLSFLLGKHMSIKLECLCLYTSCVETYKQHMVGSVEKLYSGILPILLCPLVTVLPQSD